MTAHIGADVESDMTRHVYRSEASMADVTRTPTAAWRRNAVYGDAGYMGAEKREEHENRSAPQHLIYAS